MLEMYRRQFEGELKSRAAYERTLAESVTAYKKALQKRDSGGRILSGALALVLIAFGYLLATWR
jgi:hypothetical protein